MSLFIIAKQGNTIALKQGNTIALAHDSRYYIPGSRYASAKELSHAQKFIQKDGFYFCPYATGRESIWLSLLESYFASLTQAIDFPDKQSVFDFGQRLHSFAQSSGIIGTTSDDDDDFEHFDVRMIIAGKGHIYQLYRLSSVTEFDRYHALGDGDDFALGALHILSSLSTDPKQMVEQAMEVAYSYESEIAGPTQTTHPITQSMVQSVWHNQVPEGIWNRVQQSPILLG